jgi:hypothetical protein
MGQVRTATADIGVSWVVSPAMGKGRGPSEGDSSVPWPGPASRGCGLGQRRQSARSRRSRLTAVGIDWSFIRGQAVAAPRPDSSSTSFNRRWRVVTVHAP